MGTVAIGLSVLLYITQDINFNIFNAVKNKLNLHFSFFYGDIVRKPSSCKCLVPGKNSNRSRFQDKQFQQVEGTSIFVVSAFLDNRNRNTGSIVRILGLAPLGNHHLQCKLFYQSEQIIQKVTSVRVFSEAVLPFCEWKAAFVYCPNPSHDKNPIGVSVASQNCDIEEASNYLRIRPLDGNPEHNLGLCSDTIYNFKDADVGPLIEFIEMHILLGVDQIYVYDLHNVSDGIRKILEYYTSKGVIVIVPWKVPVTVFYKDQFFGVRDLSLKGGSQSEKLLFGVKKHAQHLAYLDCLYSNMNKYKYLTFLDRDEFLIPNQHPSLVKMLNVLEQRRDNKSTAAYVSAEHHFCTKKSVITKSQNNLTQKLTSQTRVAYEGKCVKSIVKPQYIYNMRIHKPRPPFVGSRKIVRLPSHLCTVNHYRNRPRCAGKPVIQDVTVMKFYSKLVDTITKVEREINIKT